MIVRLFFAGNLNTAVVFETDSKPTYAQGDSATMVNTCLRGIPCPFANIGSGILNTLPFAPTITAHNKIPPMSMSAKITYREIASLLPLMQQKPHIRMAVIDNSTSPK